MGLEKFQIFFDLVQAVFYAGQTVSARIEVANSTPIQIKTFYVKVKGACEVCWRQTSPHQVDGTVPNYSTLASYDNRFDKRGYHASEDYINDHFAIFGWGNKGTLEPGEYSFPFSYTLPMNLPSTLEAEFGYVRYTLTAVLDRDWKSDYKTKEPFYVICPLDLNSFPQLPAPVTREWTKKFWCLCCTSGHVNVILTVPVGGAVPGETLLPTLDVENNSRVSLDGVSLKLIKSVTYHARAGSCTKNIQISVGQLYLGPLEAGQSRTYERVALPIPSLPPSYLLHCKLIDLDYFVEASFRPAGLRRNFEVQAPLVIGTIPFEQNFGSQVRPDPPLYQNLDPPSYRAPLSFEESDFGAKNVYDDSAVQ
ncbi:arrestin domain-containing protein 17-like isoform X2 [Neocloeon triangulifer]|uniref:arrestin domain-containing protein 17-like isoform X2 n=1 Tax=Neocloeon triangulifer TaxID=2078957 RepID=UPI00286EFBAB|nr:arrestin domain-containing protein 17-like isoform X2 [Neocloeon triangulifer]